MGGVSLLLAKQRAIQNNTIPANIEVSGGSMAGSLIHSVQRQSKAFIEQQGKAKAPDTIKTAPVETTAGEVIQTPEATKKRKGTQTVLNSLNTDYGKDLLGE